MRKLFFLLLVLSATTSWSQDNTALMQHYEAYYNQMRKQADVNGVINALTHLYVLQPTEERRDTLAYLYANNEQHVQALNLVGIETSSEDSDIAVEVKAISLKAIGQPQRAIAPFQEIYKRNPNAYILYELADLKIQTGENAGALIDIQKGLETATDDMRHAFYERNQPYEVSLKAALLHLRGLAEYGMNKNNIDKAIASIDEALAISPSFNLASLSKQALESRKSGAAPGGTDNQN
jgi:tetratricopeptide (TPR) repeat protein